MKNITFPGGIHPPESKLTALKAIEELSLPERVMIPLFQHIGTPCEPLVKAGDRVKTGQKIGESSEPVSASVHSSVTGTVVAVCYVTHPMGREINSIIIDTDDHEETVFDSSNVNEWTSKGSAKLKSIIQEAGIVSMGGDGLPAHIKLSPPAGRHVDTLIISGLESEPYLTSDYRIMTERPEDIITGIRILMRILDVNDVFIAIEENKNDVFQKISSLIGADAKIKCCSMKTKYPQGEEKLLIKAVCGREVPSGGWSLDCGCVVFNAGTVAAIMEAVCRNRPFIDRVISVSGPGVREPKNLKVRLGTSFQTVIDACGGLADDCKAVIAGGPMTGVSQWNLDVPVVKTTSAIVCLTDKELQLRKAQACISCGACLRACPMNLVPARIVQYAETKNWSAAHKLGILDCIECGSCSYVCPAKISLVHYIKWGKYETNERLKREKTNAAKLKQKTGS